MHVPPEHRITDAAQLAALYGQPGEASRRKEVPFLHPAYRPLVEAAPFAALATVGPEGMDVSPRGDPAGFIHIEDEHTLLLPDRRGNNRIDSLRNILADARVALLFLVPGMNETLRINGRGTISVDPALCQRFAVDGKPARSVLVIDIDTVFFQCARALLRSKLWQPDSWRPRSALPSTGALLQALTQDQPAPPIDGAAYDAELPARQAATLY
ncbi:pyridoxamine 5'-phosphate oxidase family protein [Aquabacterium sp.]|uniref:pyridoxamine 5'-phosphate oxidase family protein n=1 Tax=Aquabacterium sp. TaxID=1872578 RepID=UPI002C5B69B9|nr:pyridoxamine 5'-phosphate oxidase family protein [Aquabacterium sp.]HSW05950.1 pyridoxamine 5'-phosphate oxidase family protein [Aquabacterium sp.]